MLNSNLVSLPPSMLHKILSKVATNHLRDFNSARVALHAFNQIGREEYFYISTDLILFNDWIEKGKNRLAGERRFLLAKYVDDMLNLAFSVDDRELVHNFRNFIREFAD
ncbi:unnamed protein product [Eruca vesicaria subsp. sativa]|uniref:F-box protein n=1 Tax=Eruca vesicaria subsp. sativa TaxID=29727 RepID=A0ABC8K6J9_ERUVS|nr:unnamed protein product [Eruca vesicaria subsp. sativa]